MRAQDPVDASVPNYAAAVDAPNYAAAVDAPNYAAAVDGPNYAVAVDGPTEASIESFLRSAFQPADDVL
jgi:hypothetical protein